MTDYTQLNLENIHFHNLNVAAKHFFQGPPANAQLRGEDVPKAKTNNYSRHISAGALTQPAAGEADA